jgi:hypothetical protein
MLKRNEDLAPQWIGGFIRIANYLTYGGVGWWGVLYLGTYLPPALLPRYLGSYGAFTPTNSF